MIQNITMALIKKTTTTTKRPAYKKRVYRRRPVTSAITKAIRKSHQIKYFTEFFQASDIAISSAWLGGNFNVALSSLPNHSQYINLFDQFTIINFEVHLLQKMGAMNNNVGGLPLTLLTAINRDGHSALTPASTVPMIMGEDNCRVQNLLGNRSKIVIKVKNPKPYLLQYQGDSTLSNAIAVNQPLKRWQWLDVTQGQTCGFYGVNYVIDNPSLLDMPVFDVYYKVTIACKEQQ